MLHSCWSLFLPRYSEDDTASLNDSYLSLSCGVHLRVMLSFYIQVLGDFVISSLGVVWCMVSVS